MYTRILVPVDGSPTSEAGLTEAIRLAGMSGGRIRLMHLVDALPAMPESGFYGLMSPDLAGPARDLGVALLERGRTRVVHAGIEVDTLQLEGLGARLADVVNDQVEAWKADIVVLGTHGRHGIGRALIGSDAEQIVRHAAVPVLLVRSPEGTGAAGALPIARTAEGAAG